MRFVPASRQRPAAEEAPDLTRFLRSDGYDATRRGYTDGGPQGYAETLFTADASVARASGVHPGARVGVHCHSGGGGWEGGGVASARGTGSSLGCAAGPPVYTIRVEVRGPSPSNLGVPMRPGLAYSIITPLHQIITLFNQLMSHTRNPESACHHTYDMARRPGQNQNQTVGHKEALRTIQFSYIRVLDRSERETLNPVQRPVRLGSRRRRCAYYNSGPRPRLRLPLVRSGASASASQFRGSGSGSGGKASAVTRLADSDRTTCEIGRGGSGRIPGTSGPPRMKRFQLSFKLQASCTSLILPHTHPKNINIYPASDAVQCAHHLSWQIILLSSPPVLAATNYGGHRHHWNRNPVCHIAIDATCTEYEYELDLLFGSVND
ncbi:hypothetical protein JB92DRAFT_3159489 [Gautieria morchelliformis]|nr:hypothetical protein JB92DRAFT_3159489 [Gautieria morchelliformis]